MKVLFVGLGSVGQRHVRNLRLLLGNSAKISAYRYRGLNVVVNDNMIAEFNVNLSERYNIKEFSDFDAALREKPDAVFVTNPTALHVSTALKAAASGCHLFIEKPLSDSFRGIAKLTNIAKKKKLVVFIGFQLRFNSCLKLVKKLLDERRIGRVIAANLEFGEFLPRAHPYEDYRKAYTAKNDLGGGVILAFSHEIDYAYWFFGIPRRVFALGGKLSHLEMDAEDTASMLLEYRNKYGIMPVHIHLDFIQSSPRRTCEIIGEKGSIFWDYYRNQVKLQLYSDRQKVFDFGFLKRNEMFIEELRCFLRCLKGKAKPPVNLGDGINILKILLAAKQSLKTGKVINIR